MARLRSKISEVLRADHKYIGRHDPAQLEIVRALGSRVWDADGNELIDLVMGWCVGNLGWNHPDIVAALRRFDGPSYVLPSQAYRPWTELAAKLAELAPGHLTRCYRATTGTEAVEIALQIAMAATGRHKLVSLEGAYHGLSIATRSVGDDPELGLLRGCAKLAPPLDQKALGRLDTLLHHRDVAGFVIEPIVCNLGVLVPGPDFLAGAAALCKKYGSLLIVDEVATGFGRTGVMFASEHFELAPDVMCLAKAITSGHAPLAATIVSTEVARSVEQDYDVYSTFGWHPLAVQAALATLDYFAAHHDRLFDNVMARSEQLEAGLAAIDFGAAVELRVSGLAIAVDLGDPERADQLVEACRKQGLLITAEGGALLLFPALTIDEETVDRALDVLERCGG